MKKKLFAFFRRAQDSRGMKHPTQKSWLSPEEQAELDKRFPLRPAELDMLMDEVHEKVPALGPRERKTPDEGLAVMQDRVTMLQGDKAKLLDAMDEATGQHLAALTQDLNTLNSELAEAETRLREYQAQAGPNQN
jgi:hypothetical protein